MGSCQGGPESRESWHLIRGACTVYDDPLHSTIEDTPHSISSEVRYTTIGQSNTGKTLVVIHAEEADTIRIISAREATAFERETYEEG